MKELINRSDITTSARNLLRGASLFFEGINYEKKRQNAIQIGTHMSAFLHDGGRIATIHFREGLEPLSKMAATPLKMIKKFLSELKNDHKILSQAMIDLNSPLYSVEEIWGLCGLSPKWGERYGYKTTTWSTSNYLIKIHEVSINDRPDSGELAFPNPLSIFLHNREDFLKVFPPIAITESP